jgi:hypothetical protein
MHAGRRTDMTELIGARCFLYKGVLKKDLNLNLSCEVLRLVTVKINVLWNI